MLGDSLRILGVRSNGSSRILITTGISVVVFFARPALRLLAERELEVIETKRAQASAAEVKISCRLDGPFPVRRSI